MLRPVGVDAGARAHPTDSSPRHTHNEREIPLKITVYAGSSRQARPELLDLAAALGTAIAKRGHLLIYGGGNTGLMGAAADAALATGGRVEGVILRDFIEHGVQHEGLHELRVVDDMRSRKAGLDDPADAFVALPGGYGTFEELAEILSFRKLGFHARPIVLLDRGGFWKPWDELLHNAVRAGFEKPERLSFYRIVEDPTEAVHWCETG